MSLHFTEYANTLSNRVHKVRRPFQLIKSPLNEKIPPDTTNPHTNLLTSLNSACVLNLNMTHNASFRAESVHAAAWNRARLLEAKLSCFCRYINALMKSTRLENFQREREYGSLAKQVFVGVLFD